MNAVRLQRLRQRTQSHIAALPDNKSTTGLDLGRLATHTQHFVPLLGLAKYPFRYCGQAHSKAVAASFFDGGKFWDREWELYYLWDLNPDSPRPLILVTESQFTALLAEINTHLKLDLTITEKQREEALVTQFPDHPRCLPRYLGRLEPSLSREAFDKMVRSTPGRSYRPYGEAAEPDLVGPTLEAFRQQMEDAFDSQKNKSKAVRLKKHQERLLRQKVLADQLKRTQRYLGLRPTSSPLSEQKPEPIPAIDPSVPVPFEFDQSVVFVCVDVESYEKAHHKITEVGISSLDTQDLIGVAPGKDGENWRSKIKSHHLRIKDHQHLVNGQFVPGCPESFLFGKSTMVSLRDAPAHVAVCFNPPFCAHAFTGDIATDVAEIDLLEQRKVIFLGHDTITDVRYLQKLGYDPMKMHNILEAVDTAALFQVWRRDYQTPSLSKILYYFDIRAWALHNAGNDAAFTMQAMLAVAVREATVRGTAELEAMRLNEHSAKLAAAVDDAKQRIMEEYEGWSDHETSGDGGVPLPLATFSSKLAEPQPNQQPARESSRGDFGGRGRGRGGRGGNSYVRSESESNHSGRSQGARQEPQVRGRGGRPDRRGRGRGRGQPQLQLAIAPEPQVRLDRLSL